MHLTKNRFHQLIFYILIFFLIIFNGGNYDIYPQFNFVLVGSFFLYCFADLNYKAHIKKIFFDNKKIILLYIIFLSYLIFQILPFPQDFIKYLSPSKYKILLDLEQNNFSSISLDSLRTYFNLLNYISLVLFIIIFKTIFYKKRHVKNFYFFLILIGFFSAIIAVFFYLIDNPDFFIISNNHYKNSATGFFINRTVFACFLNFSFLAGLEYISLLDMMNKNKKDIFFYKIYVRIFLLFITIGIITTFSRIGNFLLIFLLLINFFKQYFLKNKKNNYIFYTLIFIIILDILVFGFYFGGFELIDRFAFLKNEFQHYRNDPNDIIGTQSRGDLTKFSLNKLKDFFLFGYGAGCFELLFKNYYINSGINYANHAHSDLIEFVGEFGIFGILIISYCLFYCFKKITFTNNKNIFLIFFLVFILLFDFSFHIFIIQLIFIILLSIDLKKMIS
jgi:O-antigen ligase